MVFRSSRERSPLPGKADAPSPTDNGSRKRDSSRSRSFSFLGRSKSTERPRQTDTVKTSSAEPPRHLTPKRSFSGKGKLVKKSVQRDVDELLKQAKEDIPAVPPVIPTPASPPQLQTFGGDNVQLDAHRGQVTPDSRGIRGSNAIPRMSMDSVSPSRGAQASTVAGSNTQAQAFDPYARTESMTNRGRHSYASSILSQVNGPRRVRRRKDPTPYNILVVGASGAGKTSFIEFLRKSCELPAKKQRPMTRDESMNDPAVPQRGNAPDTFTHYFLETELSDGERIGLTLWDSEGLEKNTIDLQLREITSFIESKFEETFSEENKVIRSPGKILDTHIHCVFLLLDPLQLDMNFAAARRAAQRSGSTNGRARMRPGVSLLENSTLDDHVDLQVLRTLRGKTTVIPVITKADTVTGPHMRNLKNAIWNILKENELDPFQALGIEIDDEDDDVSDADTEELQFTASSTDAALLGIPGAQNLSKSPSPTGVDSATASSNSSAVNGHAAARAKLEAPADTVPPLPFSILTPDQPDVHHNESERMPGNVGRAFPWGFADPYDEKHCDFVRLKEVILSEWRAELREKSQQVWYENWRTARLRSDKPYRPGYGTAGPPAQKYGPRQNLNAARSHPNMATVRERPSAPHSSVNPLRGNPPKDANAAAAAATPRPLVLQSASQVLTPPNPPREFSFANRDRVGSFSSPVRSGSPAVRQSPSTILSEPASAAVGVQANEVGVAK